MSSLAATLLLLLLVVAATCTVDAYPTGPPSASCLSQQPFHTSKSDRYAVFPALTGTPRFAIRVNSATWTNGGTLSVTLVGTSTGRFFEGFIMKATRASSGYSNANLGPLLGSFTCTTSAGPSAPAKYHSVYAPAGENNCVSHSRAEDNLYQNVTCTWVAPATNEGPIMFMAAVVIDYEEYEFGVESPVILNSGGAPNFATPNETMAVAERPSVFGCGSTKTCALYPPSCDVRGGCKYGVMMSVKTGGLMFELFGSTFDWLALGLGDDTEMNNLEIIACGYDPTQKKVVVSYGFAPFKGLVPLHRSDITMVKTAMDMNTRDTASLPAQPNTMYCQFMRPVNATLGIYAYNSSSLSNRLISFISNLSGQGKYVMLAQGQNIQNTPNVGRHTHIPLRSKMRFSASGSPSTMYFAGMEASVQTHGTLMTIFWLFLCGFGIVIARHTRPVLTEQVAKKQLWFLLHVGFMVLGYLVAIAGVVYILVKEGGWETDSQTHGILGLIGMGLGLLNILAGIFRPHPGAKYRHVFNRLHRWNGLLAFVFAGIAIWLGATFQSHRPEFRFWAIIVLAIWSGLQIVFMVGFECARLRTARNKREELVINKRFQLTAKASSTPSVSGGGAASDAQSTQPLEEAEPKVKGKQLVHITGAWIGVYGCVFLALAAAFWAGLWIH